MLLGADFTGKGAAAGTLTAFLAGPSTAYCYMDERNCVAPAFQGWLGWRGAIAYAPGSVIQCIAEYDTSPEQVQVIAWGIVLPYPPPI